MAAPHVVLYDSDCGFCVWAMAKVLAFDRDGRLRPLALQSPAADALLGGMEEGRKMASWHLAGPGGELHSGGAAFAPLMRLLPRGGRALAAVFARFPRASDRLYLAVADRRGALGRLLGEGARARARRTVEGREAG
ncbi:MAG: DCC1-like thiol-disulfide oxidoreductase [Thermoleophilaceae bacterium]|nr:DCC1-like thiol-disulfide oxidoreductase [Thermoleophilaceae bacterium]